MMEIERSQIFDAGRKRLYLFRCPHHLDRRRSNRPEGIHVFKSLGHVFVQAAKFHHPVNHHRYGHLDNVFGKTGVFAVFRIHLVAVRVQGNQFRVKGSNFRDLLRLLNAGFYRNDFAYHGLGAFDINRAVLQPGSFNHRCTQLQTGGFGHRDPRYIRFHLEGGAGQGVVAVHLHRLRRDRRNFISRRIAVFHHVQFDRPVPRAADLAVIRRHPHIVFLQLENEGTGTPDFHLHRLRRTFIDFQSVRFRITAGQVERHGKGHGPTVLIISVVYHRRPDGNGGDKGKDNHQFIIMKQLVK